MRRRGRWEMRVEDSLLLPAAAKARRLGVSLAQVTRDLWRAWLAEDKT